MILSSLGPGNRGRVISTCGRWGNGEGGLFFPKTYYTSKHNILEIVPNIPADINGS